MEIKKTAPLSLKIVAGLFILSGIWSVLDMIVRLTHGQIFLNFAVLALPVGIGLLRRSQFWRVCALVCLWIGMIGALVLGASILEAAAQAFNATELHPKLAVLAYDLGLSPEGAILIFNAPIEYPHLGVKLGQAGRVIGVATAAVVFVVSFWQYWVLTRPDVRVLFGLRQATQKRRRLLWGLGVLAVLVTLAAVGVAVRVMDSWPVDPVRRVQALGGRVEVDKDAPGKPVVYVSLEGCSISNADIACLEAFPQLRTLNLKNANMYDTAAWDSSVFGGRGPFHYESWGEGFDHLNGLAQLQELNLEGTAMYGDGLKHLQGLTSLRVLNLRGTHVMGQGLQYLQSLSNLTELGVSGYLDESCNSRAADPLGFLVAPLSSPEARTDAGLASLRGLTHLEILRLGVPNGATDAGLAFLDSLVNLQTLDLEGTAVTDARLDHLKGLANLEKLSLAGTKVTGVGLERLKGLAHLHSLDLQKSGATDAGLENIKDLVGLQELNLAGTHVTDAGLEHLQGLADLGSLNLQGAAVNGPGLDHLVGLSKLEKLNLGQTAAINKGRLEHIAGLAHVRELGLSYSEEWEDFFAGKKKVSGVTDESLDLLRGLAHLQSLDLTGSGVTDEGLKRLASLKELRQLKLDHTKVTGAGLKHLTELTELRELSLEHSAVNDAGLEEVGKLTRLTALNLNYNDAVTDTGLGRLEGLTDLETLDLCWAKVTDDGLKHLERLQKLRELEIGRAGGSQITDAGLVHLEGLADLRSLDLSSTGVTYAGLEHLKGLGKLRELNIEGTKAAERPASDLSKACPNMRSLWTQPSPLH